MILEDNTLKNIDIQIFIENHQGMVWIKNLDGKFVAVNTTFAQNFGTTVDNIIGKTDYDFFNEAEANQFHNQDIRLTNTKEAFMVVETLNLPHKKIITETYKAPVFNSNSEVIGTVGYNNEITDIKKLEAQNRRLLKAIEQSPVSIVVTDIDGNIEYVNPQFTTLTGYSFEEAIGKNPRILKSEFTSNETYKDLWNCLINGREWRGELCNRNKDGKIFWESAIISPVKNDGIITNYIAVKEDITDEKESKEKIQELSKLQDILVEISLRNINMKIDDIESNIVKSLQEISEFVDADRAIIFKYDWDENNCTCQHEWFADYLSSVGDELKSIDLNEMSIWKKNHLKGDVFYIPDIQNYFGESNEMLKIRGIKSLISVPFL